MALPYRLAHPDTLTLTGHNGPVTGVAVTPDGRRVVTSGGDGTVRVWDRHTGEPLHVLRGHGEEAAVLCVAVSPDGRWVASGGGDKRVVLWDTRTGTPRPLPPVRGNSVWSVAFSRDGRWLASGSYNFVATWDVEAGELVGNTGVDSSVRWLTFTPDAAHVLLPLENTVVALDRTTLEPDDPKSGRPIDKFVGPEGNRIGGGVVSPDGRNLLTTDNESAATVWDMRTRKPVRTTGGRGAGFVVYAPDGRVGLTRGRDEGPNAAWLWDLATGRDEAIIGGHTAPITAAAFTPDGRYLVTASEDGTARVWDRERAAVWGAVDPLDRRRAVIGTSDHPRAVSADGDRVLDRPLRDRVRVRQFGTEKYRPLGVRDEDWEGFPFVTAFSPDGLRVVTSLSANTLAVWEATSGHRLATLGPFPSQVGTAAFSPDGRRLVVTTAGAAEVWDATSYTRLRPLLPPPGGRVAAGSVTFDRDGNRVAVEVDHPGRVVVYNPEAGLRVCEMTDATHALALPEFSPDGRRLVAGSQDHTVRVWDVETGHQLLIIGDRRPTGSDFLHGNFALGGTRIVTWDDVSDVATVRDATTGEAVMVLSGYAGWLTAMAVSPDGRRVLTAARDGEVRVWDPITGLECLRLAPRLPIRKASSGQLHDIRFSRDGTRFVTWTDAAVALFDAAPLNRAFRPREAAPGPRPGR